MGLGRNKDGSRQPTIVPGWVVVVGVFVGTLLVPRIFPGTAFWMQIVAVTIITVAAEGFYLLVTRSRSKPSVH